LIYTIKDDLSWLPHGKLGSEAKTTLSDEEVIFEERQGKLYFIQ
jgi:valyl-tRNA synthetase